MSAVMCCTRSPRRVVSPTTFALRCQSCGLMKNIAPVFVKPLLASSAGATSLREMESGIL